MGAFSIWHWVIVLVIILLLFGKNKIPTLMGDMAKGIKAFKSGMKEEPTASPKQIDEADSDGATETVEAADAADTTVSKEKAAEG
ncbi:MAG: twin-arginine translocase TatA/TatE family subunit [Alphaproteobacteria bacterium]